MPRLPPHPRMQAGQQAARDQWQESAAEEEQPQAPPPRHVEDEGWDDTLDVPQVPQRPTHELKRRSVAASSPELSSGPAAADPYAGEEGSSLVVPLLVALALFLPAVLLLCRL